MLMAQAIRPPASPVGSVLSDTHSMSPGNGASSSILPGSEEGIGGRHGFPTRSRSPLSTTSGRNTRPRCWTIPVCASPSSRRWRGQRRRRFCQRTDCHHFGAAHRAGRRPGRQADPTRLGIRQRGPSDRGSQGRAREPNAAGAREGGDAALTGARTCFRPCCRTKMSACQGYRRGDLAHRPGRKD